MQPQGESDLLPEVYEDKSFSYTDATTFALMERLNIRIVFAFDIHFAQFGFRLLRD